MTTARLTWDSNNIDFPYGVKSYNVNNIQEYKQARAASGIPEQINQHGLIEIQLNLFYDSDVHNDLVTWWWQWAREGSSFSFALDSANVSNTTLDGSVSGATIPLTATTGLAVGDRCMVIADGDNEREIIVIQTINAGVSVVAESNLKHTFVSGDAFRHADYYPSLMTMDKGYKGDPRGGDFYSESFKWFEVLS